MSHFAEVENGIVLRVIVAEQDFINSGAVGDPAHWIQTSYNTHGGVHKNGGTPLRGNYAGIGMVYDATLDAFVAPKPFASWVLNPATFSWDAPTPQPTDDKRYEWDEDTLTWVETPPLVTP